MSEVLAGLRRFAARLPRPTPLQALRAAPVVAILIVLGVLISRNHDTVDFPHYEVPDGFVALPPPTTRPPDAVLPPLVASVSGTTIQPVPANVGSSRLRGTVSGPLGPVPFAVVRIERSILGQVQTFDAVTNETGGWDAQGLGGGRYRVRAFLPPTLAAPEAEVFYLAAGDTRDLDLSVQEFQEPSVQLAAAPVPAFLGEPVNVAVRVTGRFVDADGFVSTQPLPGVVVDLTASPSWTRNAATGSLVTGGDGQVVVTFTCRQLGTTQVSASARVTVDGAPLVAQASYDCIDPASLTTTTQPGDGITPASSTSTTEPPDDGSTTTTTEG